MIKISCKEYAANLKEELKELCEKITKTALPYSNPNWR